MGCLNIAANGLRVDIQTLMIVLNMDAADINGVLTAAHQQVVFALMAQLTVSLDEVSIATAEQSDAQPATQQSPQPDFYCLLFSWRPKKWLNVLSQEASHLCQ